MSSNVYGNLGNDMKAMKDDRATLMADIKGGRKRLHTETAHMRAEARKCLAEAGKANAQLLVETTDRLREDVARILAEASDVMKQLSQASRVRTSSWRDVLHTIHNNAPRGHVSNAAGATSSAATGRKTKARRAATINKRKARKSA